MEGFPSVVQEDLRFYLDSRGRFTTQLRRHYAPKKVDPTKRRAFVKVGSAWIDMDFNLITKGMVFRLLEDDGTFIKWEDDGTDLIYAMGDSFPNRDGVWTVQTRKPSQQELVDA